MPTAPRPLIRVSHSIRGARPNVIRHITELEELGGDTSPAAAAYRARIRARNAEWHDKRTTAEAQLTDLENTTEPDSDPSLLDELPYLTDNLASAPAELLHQLIDALDIQCLYRKDKNQATIWATITPTTPATLTVRCPEPSGQSVH
jgi:hypothetical protein